MGFRISPIAAPGSLLKGSPTPKQSKAAPARKSTPKRERDEKHLAAIRRLPCLSCDTDPAGEAAHLRMTIAGKAMPGTGNKPGDRWALPLCHTCHMRQHADGEAPFWRALGLDPLALAARLYAAPPDVTAKRAVIFKAREGRK